MPVILDPPFDPAAIQTNSKLALALAPSLAIFPCDDAKQPVYGVPWKSAQLGQIDRVQRWWSAHPDAMPGIHLGAVGLIVMDADGSEGIAAFERIAEPHGGVPECPMVDTPSGDGTSISSSARAKLLATAGVRCRPRASARSTFAETAAM